MAEDTETAPTHWAVLIGINYYPKDRCLQGCVRDVTDIRHVLCNLNSPTPVNALVLTATTPSDSSSVRPVEEPTIWPTYDNFINGLNHVKEHSRSGDVVYIHFSGHGTRLPSGQMSLVLYDDTDPDMPHAYFPGRLLAGLLQKLSDKGLFVTLVLDCCFSGGILRSDTPQGAEARFIEYDPLLDARAGQGVSDLPRVIDDAARNAFIHLDDQLLSPQGYTVISATSPYETAWELMLEESGERRGALSYFLIRALDRVKGKALVPTAGVLHQHLHSLFHAHWPKQTPMRYGNQDMPIFGQPREPPDTGFVSIFKTNGGQLRLAAGQAHGVQIGDEYAVYPFDFEVSSQSRKIAVIARVDKVGPMVSDLVEIEQLRVNLEKSRIESGWKARLVTALPRSIVSVGLLPDVSDSLVHPNAAQQYPYLHLSHLGDGERTACIFNVAINERNEYEILDGAHQKIRTLPAIPRDDQNPAEANGAILDVLQHLVKFKYMEGIDNRTPDPAFENSFSLTPIPTAETASSGNFEVSHGDEWGFIIENLGETNLFVALLDFGPSWQIADLFSDAYKSGFIVVPPKSEQDTGQEEVRLTMEVPERLRRRGHNQCEDVIKVFVTTVAAIFSPLTLPEIPLDAKAVRTSSFVHRDVGQLLDFFQGLGLGFRSPDDADSTPSHWATRNFVILTTCQC